MLKFVKFRVYRLIPNLSSKYRLDVDKRTESKALMYNLGRVYGLGGVLSSITAFSSSMVRRTKAQKRLIGKYSGISGYEDGSGPKYGEVRHYLPAADCAFGYLDGDQDSKRVYKLKTIS